MMVDSYVQDKVLDNVKWIISIEKFDDTKILIDTDYKLPDDITLGKVVILTTYVIKDSNELNPQLFLDHALYDE